MSTLDEVERLEVLRNLKVLDTEADIRLDSLTRVAKAYFDVPIALVSLVDESRQWFKSRQGLDAPETHRDLAFCHYAIQQTEPMVVRDARLDERFAGNDLVTGPPHIRFYAGAPILVDGAALGTLCIIDSEPGDLDERGLEQLSSLAEMAASFLATYPDGDVSEFLGEEQQTRDRDKALAAAEEARKESENSRQFLELMLDNIPDVIFVKDASFRHVRGNPAFFRLFPEEMHDTLIGMTGTEEFEPEEVEAYQAKDREAFENGFSVATEKITVLGGETQTFYTKKVRFEDQDGNPFLLAVAQNITEVLASEQELSDAKEFQDLILENMPDAVYVKNADGKIVRANTAFMEWFLPNDRGAVVGADAEWLLESEELTRSKLAKDREALEFGFSESVDEHLFDDGSKRTFHFKKFRFEDREGDTFILAIARDVTKERDAERKIAASSAFQNLIFESMPYATFVKDKNFQIVQANPAFQDLISGPEIVGTKGGNHFPPEQLAKLNASDVEAFEEGAVQSVDELSFLDGTVRTIQSYKTRFQDADGEQFILCVAIDITEQERIQKEIKEAQSFSSLIFENMPDAAFVKNENLETIEGNTAFRNLFPKEISEAGFVDGNSVDFDAAQLKAVHETDRKAFKNGTAQARHRLTFPGDDKRVFDSRRVRFENADGTPFILCIAADVTAKLETERVAHEAQRFQSLMLEQIPDYIFVKDEEFRIVQANQRFLGLYPEEVRDGVIGTTTLEQYDEVEREDFLTQDRLAFKEGLSEIEESIQFPDGSRRVLLTKKVRFEDQQAQKFVLGIGRDITELVDIRTQNELSHDLLENVFDTVTGAVIGLDEDRQIWMINNAGRHILAGQMGELPFKWPNSILFLDPEDMRPLESSHDPIARALIGQKIGGEVHLMTSEGSEENRYVRVTSALVQNDASPLRSVIVLDDVSEAENNRQQIERQSRLDALGQLTGGIAHDINNLLNTMQYALALIGREELSERGIRSMTAAQKSIGRGSELTTRLLAFAKKQPARSVAMPVIDVFDELKGLVKPAIEASITVSFDDVPEDLIVFCDQGQLQNAALNLILNSRDAILKESDGHQIRISARAVDALPSDPEGVSREEAVFSTEGRVSQAHDDTAIASGRAQRYVEISVSDNGPGMSKAVVSRAVDPFFTTKATNSGTGLGLSMVYGFVQQSEGEIRIYTEEGEGTTVKLFLPFGNEETGREEPVALDPTIDGKGETILVVEDEPYLLDQLTELLEELKYKTIRASSGREALALIEEGLKFDLLLTDVVMSGGLGGFELARLTRRILPDVPIIYMSGYTGLTDEEMGAVRGPLLPKPSSPAMTSAKIRSVLDQWGGD